MRSFAFDLGNTLLEYEGLPPSWEPRYDAALTRLARHLRCDLTDDALAAARATLRKYNTRRTPRSCEVPFATILAELTNALGADVPQDFDAAAAAFFAEFRQGLRCFPETRSVLTSLRSAGFRIGVLTDVAYGMPGALLRQDMAAAGVLDLIDEFVTSVDAGVRKPAPGGLELLASRLRSSPSELVFVGNEKKDVEVAVSLGCETILLVRAGAAPRWGQHRTIRSLAELTPRGTVPD